MRTNHLTVNGVDLDGPAWSITNLETEISKRQTYGDNLRIDGANGKRPLIHRIDEVVMQFQLVVRGLVDRTGAGYTSAAHGFKANCDYLIANLGLGLATGDGSVTATYHDADGTTTKTAKVIVRSFTPGDLGTKRDGMCVLELVVPSGQFA